MAVRSLVLALGLLATSPPAATADRVLFVGNSLTAANDLPLLVEAMAKARGVALTCDAVTYPDLSLEDHWRRGTQKQIARGGYTFVAGWADLDDDEDGIPTATEGQPANCTAGQPSN